MLYNKEEIQKWCWMPGTKIYFVHPIIVKFFMKYCRFAVDSRLPLYFVPIFGETSTAYKGFETKNDNGYVPCITEEIFLDAVHDYLMRIKGDQQLMDELHYDFFEYINVNTFKTLRCEMKIGKDTNNDKLVFVSELKINDKLIYYTNYDDTEISAIENLIEKLVRKTKIAIVEKS